MSRRLRILDGASVLAVLAYLLMLRARPQRCKFSFLWLIVVRKTPLRLFAGRRVDLLGELHLKSGSFALRALLPVT